jgi:hypothetical protein
MDSEDWYVLWLGVFLITMLVGLPALVLLMRG